MSAPGRNAELGVNQRQLRARLAKDLAADPSVPRLATHVEAGAKGGRGNKADDNGKSFGSNSANYIVRRLKRDRPRIAWCGPLLVAARHARPAGVGKGRGGKYQKGGIAEYARNMGRNESTMKEWICAAEVAKLAGHPASLLDYTTCLTILHRCSEEDWADLAKRMLSGGCCRENLSTSGQVYWTTSV